MRFDIMTLFPGEVDAFLSSSVIGRARSKGIIEIECHDIRNYAKDKHRHVDDYPYGGGVGMVMQVEPILLCYNDIKKEFPIHIASICLQKGKS